MQSNRCKREFAMRVAGMAILMGCVSGCNPKPPLSEFDKQLEIVRNGGDTVTFVEHELTDDDVLQLAELPIEVLLAEKSKVTLTGCRALQELKLLRRLTLRGSDLGDDALNAICEIESLEILNLPQLDASPEGLAHLSRLKQLKLLRIGSPRATNALLRTIRDMPSLRFVHLIGTPVTDEGLAAIADFQQLESLYLDDTGVTDAGLGDLLKSLPELHLHVNQTHLDVDPKKGHD